MIYMHSSNLTLITSNTDCKLMRWCLILQTEWRVDKKSGLSIGNSKVITLSHTYDYGSVLRHVDSYNELYIVWLSL